MLSLEVYGVILAGFASRNNHAILGVRATAQMGWKGLFPIAVVNVVVTAVVLVFFGKVS